MNTILIFYPTVIGVIALLGLITTSLVIGRAKTTVKTRRRASRVLIFGGIGVFVLGLILFIAGYVYSIFPIGGPAGVIMTLTGGLALTLGLAVLIANVASLKGRSWVAFYWLSVLVSPVIMGIIAATLKPLDSSQSVSSAGSLQVDSNLESKLIELQNLREKGMLSEAEFNEAKKKTLGL